MRKGIWHLLRGASALFAVALGTAAHGQDGTRFRTAQEARRYLAEEPTGPHAREAFRVIVGKRIAQQYPEYPRSGAIPARARSVAPGTEPAAAEFEAAFEGFSAY